MIAPILLSSRSSLSSFYGMCESEASSKNSYKIIMAQIGENKKINEITGRSV